MPIEPHNFAYPAPPDPTRRRFLKRAGGGFGLLALSHLLKQDGLLAGEADTVAAPSAATRALHPLAPQPTHFAPRAERVIWLFMNGGQSQVDTWDYKPELARRDGKELEGFDANTGFFKEQVGPLMKSPFRFARRGENGTYVSEIFPHLATKVDELAIMYGCYTDLNNHAPALFQMNTGMGRMGFPCVGSWVTYGLGTENQSLPGFVVMYDTLGRGIPKGHSLNWGAGFLPTVYQGTALNGQGPPIDNLNRSATLSEGQQRAQLDLLAKLNGTFADAHPQEAALAARIESFELAYRMQMTAPDALAIDGETAATRALYGLDDEKCGHFAKQCLTARRLLERGVRFVQIYSGGMENERSWDGHTDIIGNHRGFARETDQPIAALLTDLKARGLLDSTLVVCCGEFGRLPICQKGSTGRDHNPHAFTCWMAGGGTKPGARHGATDEIGHRAVEGRVHVHDLHATILNQIGLDHTKLTYRYSGRDFRLTDVAGNVVREILA